MLPLDIRWFRRYERCLRERRVTRREFFCAHRHTAVPMETRGVVAEWDEGEGD